MRVLIVGAGLYGATAARAFTDAGHDVLVVERRSEVGGQCATRLDPEVGCHVHLHGPHIFRTSNGDVWNFVNRFATFNRFVNRPKVIHEGLLYSFPINLLTLYQVFGTVTPAAARAAMEADREPCATPSNMEEWCLANMGRRLYSIFIEGYTTKQWGRHPRDLPATLLNRLPVRLTFDDNYYKGNPRQGIPIGGYTAMVKNMLQGIKVETDADYLKARALSHVRGITIYTGAIDEFFDYQLGELTYRSMRFVTETLDTPDFQGGAVVNYTEAKVPWTRVIEHKHFDLIENNRKTVVTVEYPEDWEPGKDQTYPLRTPESKAMYDCYVELAAAQAPNVIFGGRLGTYSYLDMDQVISSALGRARAIMRGQS